MTPSPSAQRGRSRLAPCACQTPQVAGSDPVSDPVQQFWLVVRTAGRRSADLHGLLETLEPHRTSIAGIVVVDSSESTQLSADELTVRYPWLATVFFDVLECRENVGPAAATNRGILVVRDNSPRSWVVVMDDDQSLPDGYLELLARSIRLISVLDPRVAGVGRIGHCVGRRLARLERPSADRIHGLVPVDYLPTNFAPAFHLPSVTAAGGMRESFFIGQTEVALGLDLRRNGFHLYAVGTLWNASETSTNWRGVTFDVVRQPWRRYYSVRNWIVLTREHLGPVTAGLVSARSVLGALLRRPRWPRLVMTARAVLDAWVGRLGRTVEPQGRESSINP